MFLNITKFSKLMAYPNTHKLVIDLVKEGNKNINIVDLGCGKGNIVKELRKLGFKNIAYCDIKDNFDGKVKIIDLNKGFKLKNVERAIRWAKELNLYTYSFFMMGFPWETKKDIEQTIRYAKRLDADFTQFSRVIPFKNTQLYDIADTKGDNFGEDRGLFYDTARYSKVSEKEMGRLIKKAYRSCFFKPRVVYKLFRTISIKDLYLLARYSIISDSI